MSLSQLLNGTSTVQNQVATTPEERSIETVDYNDTNLDDISVKTLSSTPSVSVDDDEYK
jgi:hypothetical protein